MEKELGKPVGELFSSFDDTPLATASVSEALPSTFGTRRLCICSQLGCGVRYKHGFFGQIAQVHRATTKDGFDVVVKVQHPGIREIILQVCRWT